MKSVRLTIVTGQFKLSLAKWFMAGCILLLKIVPGQSQDMSGKQIFDRMLRVYAGATTYQDQGRVQTDFYEIGQTKPKFTTIQDFTMAYDRKGRRFRFQYETQPKSSDDKPEKMVIWSLGGDVHVWWSLWDSTSHEASLGSALGIATGVSGTASRKVPFLLITERTDAGWGIDSLKDVKLIGTDTLDKSSCYRLTGRVPGAYWKNKEAVLWVDQNTFLLRRIDENNSISKTKQLVKMSLTYQPVLNKPIVNEALTFEPPRSAKLVEVSPKPNLRYIVYALIALVGLGWLIYLRSRNRKQTL
ncbi:hypothetical protein GCM10028808_38210 [Spirosoma migulaei]